jgi:hypothetical protein
MAANVRVFFVHGLETLPVVAGSVLRLDSVMTLKLPPLAGERVSCDTSTQGNSAAAPDRTGLAYVQVEDGKKVAFEKSTANIDLRTVSATASPVISGNQTLVMGTGDRLSFLEVSS